MSGCELIVLENNIHQFVFKAANRQAIDKYGELLKEALDNLGDGEPWLSILDMSESGMIPLRYGVKVISEVSKDYLTDRPNRTLVIHHGGPVAQVGQALVNPFNNNVKFMTPDSLQKGVEWLEEELVR